MADGNICRGWGEINSFKWIKKGWQKPPFFCITR
jgi:hypothetical protein